MKFIIDFKDSVLETEREAYLTEHGCNVVQQYDNFKQTYLVECETQPELTDLIEVIVNDDAHEIQLLSDQVVVNQYYGTFNPTLPSIVVGTHDEHDWWKNYILVKPEFDADTITISRKGADVSVYIMDSGIKADHPEFAEANITTLFSINDSFDDANGHGTALASVIVGKTCGLTDAKVKVVKIFEDNYNTRQSEILQALDAIMSDFLLNSNQAGVLNCSWSIPKNDYIEQKIRNLIAVGVYVVVSSGNSGLAIDSVTPASMPEVLTIGSFNVDLKPSDFSNYTGVSAISNTNSGVNSGELDGWAPGENIWVATIDGAYGYVAGTSIAAAIHSCVMAYNFSDKLVNGELIEPNQRRAVDALTNLSLSRTDLLDLSDPKYSNSANRVSTLANEVSLDRYKLKPFMNLAVRVGTTAAQMLFNPQATVSAEMLTALPAGFTITPSGLLVGSPTSVSGDYEIFDCMLRLTLIDGTIVDKEMKLAVLSESFDRTTTPEDDPIIPITLELPACTTSYVGPLSCTDNCNRDLNEFCDDGYDAKNTHYCICI
jgi:hypothetical protein